MLRPCPSCGKASVHCVATTQQKVRCSILVPVEAQHQQPVTMAKLCHHCALTGKHQLEAQAWKGLRGHIIVAYSRHDLPQAR